MEIDLEMEQEKLKSWRAKKVFIIDHPLIKYYLSVLRSKNTDSIKFRSCLKHISFLLAYPALNDLKLFSSQDYSPLGSFTAFSLSEPLFLIPIMRAGLGMLAPFSGLLPTAKIRFVGAQRDSKTFKVSLYYSFAKENFLTEKKPSYFILEPMIATGETVLTVLNFLTSLGSSLEKLVIVSIIGSVSGVQRIKKHFPSVKIFLAALDSKINSKGYIIPGLGDAGDRLFF